MSYITKSQIHNLPFLPNLFFTFCMAIIMIAGGNTCCAQENERFILVKSMSEIKDGDTVIIVNNYIRDNGSCSALGTKLNDYKNRIYGSKITINEEIAIPSSDIDRIKLEKDNTDKWLIFSITHQKYICNDNNGSKSNINKLALLTIKDEYFKYRARTKISIKENFAIIEYPYQNISERDKYQNCTLSFYYSTDSSDPNFIGYFSCYAKDYSNTTSPSIQRRIQLYKKPSSLCTLNDTVNNSKLLEANDNKSTPVILSRTLLADTWNTFCVPFDIDLKDGKINGTEVNVMEYDRTTDHTINFKNATKIEAGKAYLIKPKKDIKDPVFSDVTIKNVTPIVSGDKDGYSFVGIYSLITFNDNNKDRILILSKEGKFLSVKNGGRMKGMRAYFTIPPKTKAEAVRLMINNKPTAITEIYTTLSSPEKIFYTDGTYAGTDIKKVKKGIVIKGGKKILVK